MTSPFPPPPPSQWGPDGTGEPSGLDDPPAQGPTSYELYPAEGGWPDQPVTGAPAPQPPPVYQPQAYPPPQQAYAPPPPPAYPQAPYAPPQYMPGPPVKSGGGNKGWIIGGVLAGVLVLVCVAGLIVIGALAGDGDGDPADQPMAYTPTVAAAPVGGNYSNPSDLCTTVTGSRYDTALGMEQDTTPSGSSSDYDAESGYSSCYFHFQREDPFDYGTLTLNLTIDTASYIQSSYDSSVNMMSGSSYSGPSLGEKSEWVAENASYGESLSVTILNGNAVLSITLGSSADTASKDAIANLIVDTANEIFTAI